MTQQDAARILFIEPFCGGSHAEFLRTLTAGIDARWSTIELPARHWKWRMRGSALWVAEQAIDEEFDLLFVTSIFPLAELAGLAPRLAGVPKVLYFHENQIAYPVRDEYSGERDTHFAFTQIAAAVAADVCVFNSEFNRDSFFDGARRLLGRMPDAQPRRVWQRVEERARVLPLPVQLPQVDADTLAETDGERRLGPILLWNHRWEHDKRPDIFFTALRRLRDTDVPFRLAVCGESFRVQPPEFEIARSELEGRIVHWGYCDSRADYTALLQRCHLAVSTSDQEFFGLATMEAVHGGAAPLVPDRLAYPEIWPDEYRYQPEELVDRLAAACRQWSAGTLDLRADRRELTERFAADNVLPRYVELCAEFCAGSRPSYIARKTS